MRHVWPHVCHPSGHVYAGERSQGLHRGGRVGADDVECCVRMAGTQQRHHGAGEELRGIYVGAVVHGPGEDDGAAGSAIGVGAGARGREVGEIDAVLDPAGTMAALGRQLDEAAAFVLRDEQRVVEPGGDASLVSEQCAALARPDQPHRKAAALGIAGPLLGIDVDHVEDRGTARPTLLARVIVQDVLRHRGGEHEQAGERRAAEGLQHPLLQAGMLEVVQRERPAGTQPGQRAQALSARVDAWAHDAGTEPAQHRQMLQVGRIVGEAAEMHAVAPRQVTQHVPGTDLVALVRRVGDAVAEEQQVPHRFSRCRARWPDRSAWSPAAAIASSRR